MSVEAIDQRTGEDRRKVRRFTYPERREGFDRRAPQGGLLRVAYETMLRRLHRNDRVIFLMLVLVTVFNLADLLLTQRALVRGGVEVNPIMRFFFDIHPVWAAVVKASVGMVVVEVTWAFRRFRPAVALSVISFVGMGALFVYHLVSQRIVPI
jgi:hypothetical protein